MIRRQLLSLILLSILSLAAAAVKAEEQTLTQEELVRLKTLFPRTLAKLDRRQHVRVAAFGDGALNYASPVARETHRTLRAWHSLLLRELADRFYYGGGVQDVLPHRAPDPPPSPDAPPMALPLRGDISPMEATVIGGATIFLYNYAEDKAAAIEALKPIATSAFDVPLDMVVLMYGTTDALSGNSVAAYTEALEAAVLRCKQKGTDIIVAGPALISDGSTQSLALTRPYSQAASEIAARQGAWFVDVGGILGTIQRTPESAANNADPLSAYFSALKQLYTHGDVPDALLPNSQAHRQIAMAAWRDAVRGTTPPAIYATGSLKLADTPAVSSDLEITLRTTHVPAEGAAVAPSGPFQLSLMPVDQIWQPQGDITVPVKAFERSIETKSPFMVVKKPYGPGFLQSGSKIAFSALLHEPTVSRLLDMTGPVLPLTLDLPLGRLEGVTSPLLLDAVVKNPFQQTLSGKLQTMWMDSALDLDLAVEASGSKQLRLRLPLPNQPTLSSPLSLSLTAEGKTMSFGRKIIAIRHWPLNQPIRLTQASSLKTEGKLEQPIDLTCKADAAGLYLHFNLPRNGTPPGDNHPTAKVEILIDARNPESMGQMGHVGSLVVLVPAADGPIPIPTPTPDLFGTGYDRELEAWPEAASVTTQAGGVRQVKVQFPRAYFYLHQWSLLASGQNSLGLNAIVSFPSLPDKATKLQWKTEDTYSLVTSSYPKNDARGLGTLELRSRASGAWTVLISP